jgi:hypothetical protein
MRLQKRVSPLGCRMKTHFRSFRTSAAFAAGLLVMLSAAGCTTKQVNAINDEGSVYTPRNITGPVRWPEDIRRVAVLPVADATGALPQNFVTTYDAPWLAALQQSQRAEFVPVDRPTYARWTNAPRPPVSTSALPADWASRIAAGTGADAAMLVDVTLCSPYSRLSLGLRAKLVRFDTGEVVWAADESFDAADPEVARAARRHARAGLMGREADALAVLQSPSKFAAYAADAILSRLPRR